MNFDFRVLGVGLALGCYNPPMITSLKYTHADLLQMPDDGKRREIIDGELYVTPSPVNYHQKILLNLNRGLLEVS